MYSQEQIVDQQISDYLESKYKGFKDRLSQSSPNLKRNGQASLLGADRKVYELIKKLEQLNNKDKYHTYFDELVNAYRQYVEVADVEKKTLGEVMTPIWLVEDMLNTLPSDVWTNPNLKWLDPCAGVGTFPSIVVQRLMKGLEDFESNPIKRYRHIIEEMIYVCELQPKNMFIFQCVFDKDDTNELNTYCGSFLDDKFDKHMTDVWGVEKFDIIIGNPPYQTSKEGETKTQPIWQKFVDKSISNLNKGGYLNMVHPSGWRNVDGKFKDTQKNILSNDLLYLEIHNEKDGIKTFGAETRYDFYCLRKSNTNVKCKIKSQSGNEYKIKLNDFEFIPNDNFNEIYSLVAKDNEDKVEVLHSFSSYETRKDYMSKEQTNQFKYPIVYTVKTFDEPTFFYSSTKENGHVGISKLIWSNFRISSAGSLLDIQGEYGMTQFSAAIVDEPNNLLQIKQAFDSKRFRDLMEACAVSDMSINRKVIATFRKDFYKQFIND